MFSYDFCNIFIREELGYLFLTFFSNSIDLMIENIDENILILK